MGRVAGMTVDETRGRLVDAATQVFAEQGYDGARTSEIARRAGLSTGAIYSQYETKAELLLEAIRCGAPSELQRLLEGDADGKTLPDVFEMLGVGLHERSGKVASIMVEALVASRRDARVAEVLADAASEREAALSRLIASAQQTGQVAPDLPSDAIAHLCLTLVLGNVVAQTIGLAPPAQDEWATVIGRLVGIMRPASSDQVETTKE
jgi:TetR/AcrR family transcriptional repressor of uid operon